MVRRSVVLLQPDITILDSLEYLFPIDTLVESLADGSQKARGLSYAEDADADDDGPPYFAWPRPSNPIKDYSRVDIDHLARSDVYPVDPLLREPYAMPPLSPFDLFAIAGYLLELSGAYHHIIPGPRIRGRRQLPDDVRCQLSISATELKACRDLAHIWRRELDKKVHEPLALRRDELRVVMRMWDVLIGKFGLTPVYFEHDPKAEAPRWWRIAILLFIIADEACVGAGFELVADSVDEPRLWFMADMEQYLSDRMAEIKQDKAKTAAHQPTTEPGDQAFEPLDWYDTLSDARPDILCVLPKARTTPVGCTLRSLSHHLAILPPRGISNAQWVPRYRNIAKHDFKEPNDFNLLLVPFPYTITPSEFVVADGDDHTTRDWGFFDVKQTWLHGYGGPFQRRKVVSLLAELIERLARKALKAGANRVDAIVFPELAFDKKIFDELIPRIKSKLPDVRYIIAGLSADNVGRPGNFVCVAALKDDASPDITLREKHHRWKLDRPQIEAYGLEGVLDPRRSWWEQISLASRRVDFQVFQRGSVMAAMICEDLARVDPCQELLRAIGPNLVIALLMDAPQMKTRWPARYATVLAEDPGSSVLTLTSRGLMTHQAVTGILTRMGLNYDPVIALWRDNHHGTPFEIRCPIEAHGVWLKLWGAPARDLSIDGRVDDSAVGWIHARHEALAIDNVDRDFAHIIGPDDIKLRNRSGPAGA